MFGIFSRKCPIAAHEKLWIEQRFCWLAESFGIRRLLDSHVVTADYDWIPRAYSGSNEDVEEIFAHVCELMQIDVRRFELEIYETVDVERPAFGNYHPVERGRKERVSILRQPNDPMSFVATIVHELSHALLLGDQRISNNVSDHEWVADLTAVFLGLGVFGANSAVREASRPTGQWGSRALERQGYLTELQYAYALAIFAWTRGEVKPTWARSLRPGVRIPMMQCIRYLVDSLIGPNGFVALGHQHENQTTSDLIADLNSRRPSTRLSSVHELERRGVAAGDCVPRLVSLLRDTDWTVCEGAANLLGKFGREADPAIPEMLVLADHRDSNRRAIAVRVLGEIGADSPQVLHALAGALGDDNDSVRRLAAAAIYAFGERAAPLVEKLNKQLVGLPRQSSFPHVEALKNVGPAVLPATDNLIRIFEQGEGESREAAVVALGQIDKDYEEVLVSLCKAAADDDILVRESALTALSKPGLNHSVVRGALIDAMEHEDWNTRILAALALMKTSGESDTEAAITCLQATVVPLFYPRSVERDVMSDIEAYNFAEHAVSQLGQQAINPLVARVGAHGRSQDAFAAWALGRIGTQAINAADAVRPLLASDDATTQLLASMALWNIERQAEAVVPTLIERLRACNLSSPLDAVFHLCTTGNRAAGETTVFANRFHDLSDVYRAVIHLSIREIGESAVAPLIAHLPQVDDATQTEIIWLLATIDRDSPDDVLVAESRSLGHDLHVRKCVSRAQEAREELDSQGRKYELMTMAILAQPRSDTVDQPEREIHEALWLLVYGLEAIAQADEKCSAK